MVHTLGAQAWVRAFLAPSTPSSSSKGLSCIWQSFGKKAQDLTSAAQCVIPARFHGMLGRCCGFLVWFGF